MEIDNSETGCSSWPQKKDGTSLRPVPPMGSGKGLSYAPIDWPRTGDVWTWKVGSLIDSSGYYRHRYLSVPERLQKGTRKIWFQGKTAITRYLQSEFPEADISAFFSSFTWKIPAERDLKAKAKRMLLLKRDKKEAMTRNHASKKNWNCAEKGFQLKSEDITFSTNVPMFGRISEGHGQSSLHSDGAANENAFELNLDSSIISPKAEMAADEFESYLNSLDDILSESAPTDSGTALLQMHDFNKARVELSELLACDLLSLMTTNKLLELTSLSFKIQADPRLSKREHSLLKLIQEIPLARKDFLDAKQTTAEAGKFFEELKASKALVSTLKSKYMSSKEDLALLQAQLTYAASTIPEIDEQIASLQTRRDKLAKVMMRDQKKITELESTLKRVANSVPKVVNEIQMANSEIAGWQLKQNNAAQLETQILAKFAPLKGLSVRFSSFEDYEVVPETFP